MISIACSGFPVPVSRYFRELKAVEVSDTELGIPGEGTLRRWLREAPEDFLFTVLAPKQIADGGFVLTPEAEAGLASIANFAKQLQSRAVVFSAPSEFVASAKARSALKNFVKHVVSHVPVPVLDCPGWSHEDVLAVVGKAKVGVAFDPLIEQPKKLAPMTYLRLPGPSGYRSRYDAPALDRVVSYCQSAKTKQLFVAFRNIDRFENARYVMAQLGIETHIE
jgi:uncharacterized protein YecE (DUF72 family)